MPPLAPGPHDIEQAVEHPPQVRRPGPAARLGRRDERLDRAVLLIAQGLAAPDLSHQGAFLGRPHRRSPSGGSPQERPPGSTITGAQPPTPTFSNGL
jgi:hypothetical protein